MGVVRADDDGASVGEAGEAAVRSVVIVAGVAKVVEAETGEVEVESNVGSSVTTSIGGDSGLSVGSVIIGVSVPGAGEVGDLVGGRLGGLVGRGVSSRDVVAVGQQISSKNGAVSQGIGKPNLTSNSRSLQVTSSTPVSLKTVSLSVTPEAQKSQVGSGSVVGLLVGFDVGASVLNLLSRAYQR